MTKMIRISDGCHVASDQISETKVNSSSQTITVRTKDGIGHCHQPAYGESIWRTYDKLIAEINSANGEGNG